MDLAGSTQAARTPGWLELTQKWANEWDPGAPAEVLEPPPDGFDLIKDRARTYCLEDPVTGDRLEAQSLEQFKQYRARGWRWILRSDDKLEMLHLQAWYFQVRHFPRLSWVRLNAPDGDSFLTSDRGVAWLADGIAGTPPSALRHPTTQVVAALTRNTALVGRHKTTRFNVTPREVNRFIACTASRWVAGPTEDVVLQAMEDRNAALGH